MRIEKSVSSENYNQSRTQHNVTKSQSDLKIIDIVKQREVQKSENELIMNANEEIKKDTDEQDVIKAIEKANKHINVYGRKLEFSIHDTTKQIMVKVINTEDNSIIREIPSEKILDMVGHLWELAGILVDERR